MVDVLSVHPRLTNVFAFDQGLSIDEMVYEDASSDNRLGQMF